MNRSANSTSGRRAAPKVTVKLDLTDEKQHFIHGAIHRMHTGRWPLFRAFAMRQVGTIIYEVAEWQPRRNKKRPRFTVLRWDACACGLSWQDQRSRRAALRVLLSVTNCHAGEGSIVDEKNS